MENYEIIRDEREGVSIKSKLTHFEYDLLEGKSLNGKTTSDICFIMISIAGVGYIGVLNYYFGVDDVESALYYIEAFENKKAGVLDKLMSREDFDLSSFGDELEEAIKKDLEKYSW